MTRHEPQGTAAATRRATWYCGTATTTAMGEAKGSHGEPAKTAKMRENMGGRRHKTTNDWNFPHGFPPPLNRVQVAGMYTLVI